MRKLLTVLLLTGSGLLVTASDASATWRRNVGVYSNGYGSTGYSSYSNNSGYGNVVYSSYSIPAFGNPYYGGQSYAPYSSYYGSSYGSVPNYGYSNGYMPNYGYSNYRFSNNQGYYRRR